MNKTVIKLLGLALLFQVVISQTDAMAQEDQDSYRRHSITGNAHGSSDEFVEDNPQLKSLSDGPEVRYQEERQPNLIRSLSPRAALDLSTTERVPEPAGKIDLSPAPSLVDARVIKEVVVAGDRFYHRALPFEEPLHERYGISYAPPVQLTKSTLVFFGKSLLLPANLLPRRHNQRDCDSNEGWRETQGRQACQRYEWSPAFDD